jgi:predicted transcriptional regulator
MDIRGLKVLELLMGGDFNIRELASKLGLSYSRTATIVRHLVKGGYCEKQEGKIRLARNAKTSLLKELAYQYDISSLLGEVREDLLLAIREASSILEIQRKTGFAQSTIYQNLRELMTIGAIRKLNDHYVVAEETNLKSFLELLSREKEANEIEHEAVLLYSHHGIKLKMVPAGKEAVGSKTAFSLFPNYGLDYFSPYDYYVEPPMKVSMEECLIHALIMARNKLERTMCAIFYLKNYNRINTERIKTLAKKYGVLQLLTKLQNYVRGSTIEADIFLPWDEFKERASIYGVHVSPPPGYEKIITVLRMLGEKLDAPTTVYLFGGANLLLRGLKSATKDLDIVAEDSTSFFKLKDTLLKLGFRMLTEHEMTSTDRKLSPSGILVSPELPRFDIFTRNICNAFSLTEEMKKRSEPQSFGKLELRLLSLEDVFLLKSITEREGDIEDMTVIVRHGGGLDWNVILETYFKEEKKIKRHLCFKILDSIEILQEREKITIPIRKPLLRHCIDIGILQSVKQGAKSVKEVRKLIDFPEYMVRNRITRLVGEGKTSKKVEGKRFILSLTAKGRSELFD